MNRRRARTPGSRRTPALASLVAVGVLAAACSEGSEDPAADDSPSGSAESSAEESAEPYLPVPEDVQLTAQGTELSFGDAASVAWRPRTTTTGVLDVTVKKVQRAPLSVFSGFRLDKQTRQSAAYFVRVDITNTGESNLSGMPVPLYLVDGENTLIEPSSFASRFGPCPSRPFPRGFTPGEQVSTCLVYLAPDKGDAEAVSFRPSQAFNPIVWSGEPTKYQAGKNDQGKKQGSKKQGDKQGNKKQQDG